MPATDTLLKEFEHFFQHYQDVWNGCNAEEMNAFLSKEIAIRWAGPEANISDWGYEEAKMGWEQAYQQYEGRQPKWHFKVLHITPATENEVIATFWVTFEIEGKLLDVVKLFIQRFRKEQNDWTLIREYCEHLHADSFISN
ncbi:hypothetical protein U1P98_15095 [Lysinibacillus irui]|uniref:Uncharacterized protein n=2 Tax=Lysinibacillus TaxID=400634 RepID=A0AAJ5RY91_9BACI|nr:MULTISPECIES: hypothetical protein [Lysinibacillus]MEA0555358.1 hypothetical protein [Lysinibacillus irui]MEA0565195.1 hypothetical protein [Lysinibacillus irui]MEA0977634.1 hypothetical protein [Lysinibacillus irui]MEA1043788.1 hypothetical protein [Lysinibacillus irui]WDV08524.1 hypothetical protein OU989_08600 [Lysinibacillus irui]